MSVNLKSESLNTSEIMLNSFTVRSKLRLRDLCLESRDETGFDHSCNIELSDQLLLSLNQTITDANLNGVIDLLKKGADPNTIDSSGNRPIHLAIQKSPNNPNLVRTLIQFGAMVNVANNKGATPLAFSLNNRCYKTSEILIKRGSDLNFQCHRGWTPLMIAAMNGNLDSVRIMLLHGADVNKCDVKKRTALMFACKGSYLSVIRELLSFGANPGMRDDEHNTAFHYYMDRIYPRLEIVNELLLHCCTPFVASRDLTFNPIDSFLQIMNKCLREGPPYHACITTIIKIQMLITCDSSCVARFGDLYNTAVSCCAESRYMGMFKVNSWKSVGFLLAKCVEGYMPRESELEGLLPYVAKNNFPIYSDMLRALLLKPFLRKKFINTLLFTMPEGCRHKITLHSDINILIMPYLSDHDIANFVLAAYI